MGATPNCLNNTNNTDMPIIFSFKKYIYFYTKFARYCDQISGGQFIEWKYSCRFSLDYKQLYRSQKERLKLLMDGRHRIIEKQNNMDDEHLAR